jgi:alpha-N-arabinofuranosidase
MDALLAKQSAIMDRYDPTRKLMIAVDEWGIWLAPTQGTNPGFLRQQNSMRDAILAALNLDIFIRHAERVRLANIAQMVNVLQAMILTEGAKMVLTPTYHVYRLYRPFQDATRLPVRFDAGTYGHREVSLPRVDAVAARGTDGRLWLALVNLDSREPAEVEPALTGGTLRFASGEVLTASKIDSVNSFAEPKAVVPNAISATADRGRVVLRLPPRSVAVVALER